MKNLSTTEMVNINGGDAHKKKERSGFGQTLDAIGGAITGIAGLVTSWFS